MSGIANTSVEEIADCMRARKRAKQACSLLIGAGCSLSAGIPLANGFVNRIQEDHNAAYRRAKTKTYPAVMAELGDGYRRDLVADAIDKAHINWAHIAIAQLMKHGYVSRVLTTNFDPLVVRACAMVGEFPAVYDFAASQNFHPEYLPEKAVFYLHGQRDGFILLHTDEDVKRHSANLAPLFREAGQGRMWLVAGYSGENDPVFEHLEAVERFHYNLTWARYEDEDPPPHLTRNLLKPGKGTLYLRGYDADRLFVELAQRLDCFPPDFISAPFQHLRDTLDRVGPFQLPHKGGQLDIVQEARKRIDHAESVVRDVADTTRERVLLAMSRGDYEEAVRDVSDGAIAQDDELRGIVATAHFMLGFDAQRRGRDVSGDDHAHALNTAIDHYKNSIAIKPDSHEAWNNWGIALIDQAKTKDGEDAQRLFDLAAQKFAEASAIKPDHHEAFNNWGAVLANLAKAKGGEDARPLFDLAAQKFAEAITIKPDYHYALYNWGNTLVNLARAKGGEDAQRFFELAGQKYAQAIVIKPDKHESLFNLACLNGLQHDEAACRTWLTRSLSIPHPDAKHLLATDTDLDSMRDRPWFQEMLAAL
ncbi:hypothetical protein D3877_07745 [Azospirillum cavernae]|uniref:SIR2-like domain-containing protein n=1 Tax=Azospirillum cavernae TaxID=2320860 RepID=A0A418W326_9PROT|nr:hypothetical protein [Azospirillum cavernae]RJF84430.1 hypothetical protein D3877_07745 [Azospirillum cavernae]